jgi:Domain of unknown function (DUF4386)
MTGTRLEPASAAGSGELAGSAPVGREAGRPQRRTAVLVGVLFLTSTAAFAVGSSLVASHFSGDSPTASTLLAGVLLQVYAGLAVAGIGLAMLPLLRPYSLRLARAYLALRVLECSAIVILGAFMLATRRALEHDDLLIYSLTAVGGIILSYLLYVSRLVPRQLAALGMLGYVALLLGIPIALLGLADLDAGWGMLFLAPGGLFELVFPVLLIARGFSVDTTPGTGGAVPGGPLRRAAVVAGIGLLVMAALALASFSALEGLVVEGDATATAGNIVEHELRFRMIVGGFLVVAVLDVVVAWALYVFLRPTGRSIALLAAWLRVAYAAVFAAAVSNLVVAARLLTDASSLDALGPRQLPARAMTAVDEFTGAWNVALAIFGLHLLVLGGLALKSSHIPSLLGILVMVAGLGYLADSFGELLSTSYDANVAGFTFAGEVLLMGWLLFVGLGGRHQAAGVDAVAASPPHPWRPLRDRRRRNAPAAPGE